MVKKLLFCLLSSHQQCRRNSLSMVIQRMLVFRRNTLTPVYFSGLLCGGDSLEGGRLQSSGDNLGCGTCHSHRLPRRLFWNWQQVNWHLLCLCPEENENPFQSTRSKSPQNKPFKRKKCVCLGYRPRTAKRHIRAWSGSSRGFWNSHQGGQAQQTN